MQIVNVLDCSKYIIPASDVLQTPAVPMYKLMTGENTTYEWNGDATVTVPFSFASPWDSVFQSLMDIYGDTLIGKQIVYDPAEPNGNIIRIV